MSMGKVIEHLKREKRVRRHVLADRYGNQSVRHAADQPDVVQALHNGEVWLAYDPKQKGHADIFGGL